MPFEITPNVAVHRNRAGEIRRLQHIEQPYRAEDSLELRAAVAPIGPRQLAEQYIADVLPHYQLEDQLLTGLRVEPAAAITDDSNQIRFYEEKTSLGNTTVGYAQTFYGIPVWEAGFAVRMEESPLQVLSSHSSLQANLNPRKPAPDAAFLPDQIDPTTLASLLRLDPSPGSPTINQSQPFIYRYDTGQRTSYHRAIENEDDHDFDCGTPTLPLPPVAEAIADGNDYVVSEVLFTLNHPTDGELNWSALVEVETGSILRLRALVGCLTTDPSDEPTGCVYLTDPITKTGDDANFTGASEAVLNSHRDDVVLRGLTPTTSGDQELRGEFVRITNVSPPNPPAPTSPAPGTFCFSAPTDDFSAVNAYYQCDRLFRLLEELGSDVHTYFDGTTFPVRVDHRATINGASNTVNASAPGNFFRTGSDGFRFALARTNTSLGMAAAWRVVLHEFGHALLWDHVRWPNFGFAHSAGDSLAAILNDPGSLAARGETFPWVPIRRRHDRRPVDGWAWGGPNDDPFTPGGVDPYGYRAEQILSSTMFRIYRSAGGDADDIDDQQFSAHYVVYLIINAISQLTPFNNANRAEDFADVLLVADTGTFQYEGTMFPCGVLRKVIRWGFEQQGAYQPVGTAGHVFDAGDPPAIDLYIDDGRDGQYEYQADFDHAPDIWVRHIADGNMEHQEPNVGVTNFVYIRVKNRGSQPATSNVRVDVFESSVATDQVWPSEWQPLSTPHINVPEEVAAGGEKIVGPFEWTPTSLTQSILASVSCDGDLSHADRFTTATPIPNRRLVSTDNNIAQRKMVTT